MTITMDNTISTKIKRSLEETAVEVNRILSVWKTSNKRTSFEDSRSVFRTYFFKHLKQELGWDVVRRYIKEYSFEPCIENNRLVNISGEKCSYLSNDYLDILKTEIKTFDFTRVEFPKEKLELAIANNYEHILNIKF